MKPKSLRLSYIQSYSFEYYPPYLCDIKIYTFKCNHSLYQKLSIAFLHIQNKIQIPFCDLQAIGDLASALVSILIIPHFLLSLLMPHWPSKFFFKYVENISRSCKYYHLIFFPKIFAPLLHSGVYIKFPFRKIFSDNPLG